ncbi:unnamed protein product, partial [Arabidopsis halleri]
ESKHHISSPFNTGLIRSERRKQCQVVNLVIRFPICPNELRRFDYGSG